ncbi:gp53-like domain-containing protein, partial [Chromobacterium vaccinii]|uniref:gp53-like domain-containing protein n=1 Tax=Chromobacterium vaccinii TaxID=1108595 RepID=UPI003C7670F6
RWKSAGSTAGGSNWVRLGTGLIFQWGKSSICGPTNNGSRTEWQSFPIQFPSGTAQTLQATLTGDFPGGDRIWQEHSVRSFISGNAFYFWVAAPNNGGYGACYGIDWLAMGF